MNSKDALSEGNDKKKHRIREFLREWLVEDNSEIWGELVIIIPFCFMFFGLIIMPIIGIAWLFWSVICQNSAEPIMLISMWILRVSSYITFGAFVATGVLAWLNTFVMSMHWVYIKIKETAHGWIRSSGNDRREI